MKTKFFHRIALSIALTIGASIAVAQTNVTTDVVTVNLQTDTVKVMSQKMNREIKAVVVLPHQYFDNPTDSFPSVYVLHGASGNRCRCALIYPHNKVCLVEKTAKLQFQRALLGDSLYA